MDERHLENLLSILLAFLKQFELKRMEKDGKVIIYLFDLVVFYFHSSNWLFFFFKAKSRALHKVEELFEEKVKKLWNKWKMGKLI